MIPLTNSDIGPLPYLMSMSNNQVGIGRSKLTSTMAVVRDPERSRSWLRYVHAMSRRNMSETLRDPQITNSF